MAYKRLSRKDYQNLIGIANGKKKPRARRRRKRDQRDGITVPDLLLAKMISNVNRNWVQRYIYMFIHEQHTCIDLQSYNIYIMI